MALSPNSAEVITLPDAKKYTSNYRMENPDGIKAFFVGANHINQILNQPDCIGIRIYNGIDSVLKKNNLVLVGVDSNENDMTNGILVEKLVICPPVCASGSELMQ